MSLHRFSKLSLKIELSFEDTALECHLVAKIWKTCLVQVHAGHFPLCNRRFLLHQDRGYSKSNLLPNDSSIDQEDSLQNLYTDLIIEDTHF